MNSDDSVGWSIAKFALGIVAIILSIAGCIHATDVKPQIVQWLNDRGYTQVTISDPDYVNTFDCYKTYSYDVTAIHDDQHVTLKICESLWNRKIYDEKHA